MAEPARHLRIVDQNSGEVLDECPNCQGAEKEVRAWRVRYANIARDKEREGREHELWPKAVRLFQLWQTLCKHPRTEWSADRFWLCLPYLQKDIENETNFCELAIEGIAYDPNTKEARNGMLERFDSWELLFRNRGTFERYCNRAPHHLPSAERVKRLADALVWVWGWSPERAVHEAQVRLR